METVLPEDIMEKSASKHVIEIDLFKELGDAIEASIIMKVKQMVNSSASNPYAGLNLSVDNTDYENVKIIPMSPVSIEITNFESENRLQEPSDSKIEETNLVHDKVLENYDTKSSEHTDEEVEEEIPKQPDLDLRQVVLSQSEIIKDQDVAQNNPEETDQEKISPQTSDVPVENEQPIQAMDVEENETFDLNSSGSTDQNTKQAQIVQGQHVLDQEVPDSQNNDGDDQSIQKIDTVNVEENEAFDVNYNACNEENQDTLLHDVSSEQSKEIED